MKLTKKDPDLNLILESLQEVGITVELIKIKGHTCMTDENGSEMYINKDFNIFDDYNLIFNKKGFNEAKRL